MTRSDVSACPADADETGALASEMARAYKQMVRFYRDQMELTGPEADRRARDTDATPEQAAADLERIRLAPPEQVSWFQLSHILERDPDAATAVWGDLKAAAREELASGHRTAHALDWDGRPWDRARFHGDPRQLQGRHHTTARYRGRASGHGVRGVQFLVAAE